MIFFYKLYIQLMFALQDSSSTLIVMFHWDCMLLSSGEPGVPLPEPLLWCSLLVVRENVVLIYFEMLYTKWYYYYTAVEGDTLSGHYKQLEYKCDCNTFFWNQFWKIIIRLHATRQLELPYIPTHMLIRYYEITSPTPPTQSTPLTLCLKVDDYINSNWSWNAHTVCQQNLQPWLNHIIINVNMLIPLEIPSRALILKCIYIYSTPLFIVMQCTLLMEIERDYWCTNLLVGMLDEPTPY